jgi:hypothetical protein
MARKLAFAATGGNQGIVAATDLEVRELAVPSDKIRVFPGVCAIRNKASDAKNETYIGSMLTEEEITIVATGGGGPRSDMICARVENPFPGSQPWPDPGDLLLGPYIKTVVLSNVSNTAVVPPGGNGDALIPLARIDIPASTGTIIQTYIKDLRKMSSVLRDSKRLMLPCPGQHTMPTSQNTFTRWPNPPMTDSIKVDIPDWATKCFINGIVTCVNLPSGNAMGELRGGLGSLRTGAMRYDFATPVGGVDRGTIPFGGELALPAAMRGTSQILLTEARSFTPGQGATVPIYAELYSTVSIQIEFEAAPASNL